MLYSFHSSQTAKNPDSLTATYLLCGTIPPASTKTQRSTLTINDGDNDVLMTESSPPPSSWMQDSGTPADTQVEDLGEDYDSADGDVPLTHIVMAREDELEEVKAEFDELRWIHIYSLQPSGPTDIHVISVANEAITKSYLKSINNDPTEPLKGLGAIINKHAVWRDVQNSTAGAAKVVKPVATGATVTTKMIPTLKRESSNKSNKPIPAPKGKASIMSSFAKTPKATPKPQVKKEDEVMKETPNFSDDDDDEDEIDEGALRAAEESVTKAAAAREAKVARHEKLKAMMDSDSDDDVEMSDAPAKPSNGAQLAVKKEVNPTSEDEDNEEQEIVDTSAALDAKPIKDEPKQEEFSTTENGRRRGRRRVMKKRRYQDEDGCLVTKEEMQWESYSEDEPVPKPEAKKLRQSLPAPGKKKGAAGGPNKQVNIMAFFGKK